ncbi:zinc finger protein 567-like [Anopheles ziemanni]|uniref:zinc finger protein 567-like n=1 Tax=Anopheles ziemanni TaxID=345580 RepID=UPI00265FBB30|nr:zinc finger protein 567-like [Anopheles ziemanni]
MVTVCEVCYVSSEAEYLEMFSEDHKEKRIADNLEDIENPHICLACWTIVNNFHGLYNLAEDLHRPQPESCSSSDDDAESSTKETASGGDSKHRLVKIDTSNDEEYNLHYETIDEFRLDTESVYMDDDSNDTTVEVPEEEHLDEFDPTAGEESTNEEQSCVDGTEVDIDTDEDGSNLAAESAEENNGKDSALIEFYGVMLCEICESDRMSQNLPSTAYDTFVALKRHMLEVHQIARTYLQCPLCSKRIFLHYKLWQHIEYHDNPEKYRCTKCGETHQDLEVHMHNKHMEKRFQCTDCDRRYSSAHRLATHAKVTHSPKDVVCEKCNKVFNKYLIKGHMRSIHGEPLYVCEWCGESYRTIALLNKHNQLHQAVLLEECPVCKLQVRANYIDRHMKLMHTKRLPVECASCGKSFLTKRRLLVHQDRSCSAKMYNCPTCGKIFKTVAKLNEHQTTHNASASVHYVCSVCMEKFDSKSRLYAHHEERHKMTK